MIKSYWRKKANEFLKHGSTVNFSGENITNLGLIGTFELMKTLDLSFITISSIEGLKRQPNLKEFIANDSAISSFKNFFAIQNVSKLSLIKTPLSSEPNFLLNVAIILPNITIVNGKLLPQNIKQQSLKYPFVAAKLINAGWLATSRIPTDEEFDALCNEYNISPLNNYYTHEEEEEDSEIQIEEDDAERFEDILRGFYIEHDKIVSRARRYCGLEVPEEEEDTFDIEDTEEDFLEPISSSNTNSNPNLHDTSLNDQICIEKTQNGEVIERFGDENDSTSDSYQQPNLVSRVAEILRRNGLKVDPGNEHEDVLKLLSELCDRNPTTNESQMIDQIRAKND